jgi:hypothetical protein
MDLPEPAAHLIFLLYTLVTFLTLGVVANAHSFECVTA